VNASGSNSISVTLTICVSRNSGAPSGAVLSDDSASLRLGPRIENRVEVLEAVLPVVDDVAGRQLRPVVVEGQRAAGLGAEVP